MDGAYYVIENENTTLSKSIDFFPFPKKTGRSPSRGERSLPCFFLYLIYVELRRDASVCILPLTIIIIIPPPSCRRRYQQPPLPPRRRPFRRSPRLRSRSDTRARRQVARQPRQGAAGRRRSTREVSLLYGYQSSAGSSPSPSGWYASASSSLSPERRGESVL